MCSVLKIKEEGLLKPVNELNKVLFYYFILIISIVVLVSYVSAKHFTNPLIRLKNIAKRISQGDFNVKVNKTTNDEIGELYDIVKIMKNNLKGRKESLELKLNKSTKEIKKKNEELRKSELALYNIMDDLEKANKQILNEKKLIEQKVRERTLELRKAYNKLKKLDEAKNEFISIVSHELKSPLFPVLGFIELMLKGEMGKLTKQQKEKLKLVYKNASDLLKLIEDMLTLSKLDLKKLNLEIKNVNLANLAKSIKNSLKPVAEKYKVNIKYNGPRKLMIKADEFRVKEAITNIVRNAILYNKKNGSVLVNVDKEKGYAVVTVKDTGIGIPKKEMDNLFNRFYQVEKAAVRKHEGSGLGLSIAKGLIDLHKGKIEVESKFGKGTMFKIYLPIKKEA
ncbi:HAMP domain-containing protein [Candidatus Woesearchaeota archaeon]|nr:MAG: HAMP domain-containing protein [Candidatus Woesearchaeota archaeon]